MSAREYKLIFTGTMGAGKTTAIGESKPVSTDVPRSEAGDDAKKMTTAALDYGDSYRLWQFVAGSTTLMPFPCVAGQDLPT